MAYRPTNDTTENVIHRNTIFDSQGMVSCCTCGYCIKKTEDATLELTNFKSAPPIINEQSIGSGVLEFSDYMIPSGSFGPYILSPDNIQKNLNIESLSDGFIYYPFLNCKGTTSVPLNDASWGSSVLEDGFFTKPVKTYGVEVQSIYYYNPNNPFPIPTYQDNSFGRTFYYSEIYGNQFRGSFFIGYNDPNNIKDNYSWYSVGPYPPTTCRQSDIDIYSSKYGVNKSPVYPPLTNTGSLDNYFSYINSNDYSIEGFKTDASCSNNIVPLMSPSYYLNVSSYQFSYQYPDYTFFSSVKTIFSGSSPEGEPVPPFGIFEYGTLWIYDSAEKKINEVYKNGYVLKDFEIDKFGKFSSSLTLLPIKEVKQKKITNNLYNNPNISTTELDIPIFPAFRCTCLWNMWVVDSENIQEEIISSYKAIGTSSAFGGVISSIYGDNQELIDYRLNGRFDDLLYNNIGGIGTHYIGDVSFGANKFPSIYDPSGYTYVIDQPYVPLKYIASKTDRTQITSTTDASGRTTLTIKNILWAGKTLLTNNYGHNLGVNAPGLANGKLIPQAYQAILKGGFESDAIISFQSVPLCKMVDITDQLRKVAELKVNFENYRKIPQMYMANYDATMQLINASPGVLDRTIYPSYYGFTDFQQYLGFPAFTMSLYYSIYILNGYYNYGFSVLEFNNTEFYPPNINSENQFRVRNKITVSTTSGYQYNAYEFNVVQKDIVTIDPPVLTSYVAKPGRVYPDFGVPDRFKSCLLINGDASVWQTGNEVKIIGFDYLVTNGGTGYTSTPTVTISGGGGTGATAYATISNGKVISVTIGSKGINYTSNKNVVISGGGGTGATAVNITFTPFHSIYMEEIKDEKQTAGQSLIRIATTLENANNGIYIPNVGLETLYKDKSLSVKFLYNWKDVSIENLPRYENVNLNDPVASNINADIVGGYYSKEAQWKTDFNGTLNFNFTNYYGLNISFRDKITNAYIESYRYLYWRNGNNFYSSYIDSFLEVISLSPLKIKYKNVTFDAYGGDLSYTNFFLTNPGFEVIDFAFASVPKVIITANLPFLNYFNNVVGLSMPGFQCDVVMEEVVDEFINPSLPVEFNQILENVEYIQTSNLINSRTPMQMINPEQCEHIGKVIDRKDCNCPKKWVRLCDVHGKTDWKQCMQCKDFKVSE